MFSSPCNYASPSPNKKSVWKENASNKEVHEQTTPIPKKNTLVVTVCSKCKMEVLVEDLRRHMEQHGESRRDEPDTPLQSRNDHREEGSRLPFNARAGNSRCHELEFSGDMKRKLFENSDEINFDDGEGFRLQYFNLESPPDEKTMGRGKGKQDIRLSKSFSFGQPAVLSDAEDENNSSTNNVDEDHQDPSPLIGHIKSSEGISTYNYNFPSSHHQHHLRSDDLDMKRSGHLLTSSNAGAIKTPSPTRLFPRSPKFESSSGEGREVGDGESSQERNGVPYLSALSSCVHTGSPLVFDRVCSSASASASASASPSTYSDSDKIVGATRGKDDDGGPSSYGNNSSEDKGKRGDSEFEGGYCGEEVSTGHDSNNNTNNIGNNNINRKSKRHNSSDILNHPASSTMNEARGQDVVSAHDASLEHENDNCTKQEATAKEPRDEGVVLRTKEQDIFRGFSLNKTDDDTPYPVAPQFGLSAPIGGICTTLGSSAPQVSLIDAPIDVYDDFTPPNECTAKNEVTSHHNHHRGFSAGPLHTSSSFHPLGDSLTSTNREKTSHSMGDSFSTLNNNEDENEDEMRKKRRCDVLYGQRMDELFMNSGKIGEEDHGREGGEGGWFGAGARAKASNQGEEGRTMFGHAGASKAVTYDDNIFLAPQASTIPPSARGSRPMRSIFSSSGNILESASSAPPAPPPFSVDLLNLEDVDEHEDDDKARHDKRSEALCKNGQESVVSIQAGQMTPASKNLPTLDELFKSIDKSKGDGKTAASQKNDGNLQPPVDPSHHGPFTTLPNQPQFDLLSGSFTLPNEQLEHKEYKARDKRDHMQQQQEQHEEEEEEEQHEDDDDQTTKKTKRQQMSFHERAQQMDKILNQPTQRVPVLEHMNPFRRNDNKNNINNPFSSSRIMEEGKTVLNNRRRSQSQPRERSFDATIGRNALNNNNNESHHALDETPLAMGSASLFPCLNGSSNVQTPRIGIATPESQNNQTSPMRSLFNEKMKMKEAPTFGQHNQSPVEENKNSSRATADDDMLFWYTSVEQDPVAIEALRKSHAGGRGGKKLAAPTAATPTPTPGSAGGCAELAPRDEVLKECGNMDPSMDSGKKSSVNPPPFSPHPENEKLEEREGRGEFSIDARAATRILTTPFPPTSVSPRQQEDATHNTQQHISGLTTNRSNSAEPITGNSNIQSLFSPNLVSPITPYSGVSPSSNTQAAFGGIFANSYAHRPSSTPSPTTVYDDFGGADEGNDDAQEKGRSIFTQNLGPGDAAGSCTYHHPGYGGNSFRSDRSITPPKMHLQDRAPFGVFPHNTTNASTRSTSPPLLNSESHFFTPHNTTSFFSSSSNSHKNMDASYNNTYGSGKRINILSTLQETHTTVPLDTSFMSSTQFFNESSSQQLLYSARQALRSSLKNESVFIPASASGALDAVIENSDNRGYDEFVVQQSHHADQGETEDVRQSKLMLLKTKQKEKLGGTQLMSNNILTLPPYTSHNSNELFACPHCPRKFTQSALERHVTACLSVFGTVRAAIDFRAKRAKNTPLEHFVNGGTGIGMPNISQYSCSPKTPDVGINKERMGASTGALKRCSSVPGHGRGKPRMPSSAGSGLSYPQNWTPESGEVVTTGETRRSTSLGKARGKNDISRKEHEKVLNSITRRALVMNEEDKEEKEHETGIKSGGAEEEGHKTTNAAKEKSRERVQAVARPKRDPSRVRRNNDRVSNNSSCINGDKKMTGSGGGLGTHLRQPSTNSVAPKRMSAPAHMGGVSKGPSASSWALRDPPTHSSSSTSSSRKNLLAGERNENSHTTNRSGRTQSQRSRASSSSNRGPARGAVGGPSMKKEENPLARTTSTKKLNNWEENVTQEKGIGTKGERPTEGTNGINKANNSTTSKTSIRSPTRGASRTSLPLEVESSRAASAQVSGNKSHHHRSLSPLSSTRAPLDTTHGGSDSGRDSIIYNGRSGGEITSISSRGDNDTNMIGGHKKTDEGYSRDEEEGKSITRNYEPGRMGREGRRENEGTNKKENERMNDNMAYKRGGSYAAEVPPYEPLLGAGGAVVPPCIPEEPLSHRSISPPPPGRDEMLPHHVDIKKTNNEHTQGREEEVSRRASPRGINHLHLVEGNQHTHASRYHEREMVDDARRNNTSYVNPWESNHHHYHQNVERSRRVSEKKTTSPPPRRGGGVEEPSCTASPSLSSSSNNNSLLPRRSFSFTNLPESSTSIRTPNNDTQCHAAGSSDVLTRHSSLKSLREARSVRRASEYEFKGPDRHSPRVQHNHYGHNISDDDEHKHAASAELLEASIEKLRGNTWALEKSVNARSSLNAARDSMRRTAAASSASARHNRPRDNVISPSLCADTRDHNNYNNDHNHNDHNNGTRDSYDIPIVDDNFYGNSTLLSDFSPIRSTRLTDLDSNLRDDDSSVPLASPCLPSPPSISSRSNKAPHHHHQTTNVGINPRRSSQWSNKYCKSHLSPQAAAFRRRRESHEGDWPNVTVSSRLYDLQAEMSRLEARLLGKTPPTSPQKEGNATSSSRPASTESREFRELRRSTSYTKGSPEVSSIPPANTYRNFYATSPETEESMRCAASRINAESRSARHTSPDFDSGRHLSRTSPSPDFQSAATRLPSRPEPLSARCVSPDFQSAATRQQSKTHESQSTRQPSRTHENQSARGPSHVVHASAARGPSPPNGSGFPIGNPAERALSQLSRETKALTQRVDRLLQRNAATAASSPVTPEPSRRAYPAGDHNDGELTGSGEKIDPGPEDDSSYDPNRYAVKNEPEVTVCAFFTSRGAQNTLWT